MLDTMVKDVTSAIISTVVCDFEGKTHEEWQELRATHYGLNHITLGGSDAGVIMGVSKWKDLPQLYLEKTGAVSIPVKGEAIEWGNIMEPIIADKFARENPHLLVAPYNVLLQHPEHKHAVANIDRLLYDPAANEYGILEVKTASEYVSNEWDYDNIPPSYYAQIQHYFAVTGLSWGWFAVLIGGNRFHQVKVERDDEYINGLLFQEEMFIQRIEMSLPPEITGSESSGNVLSHLYPQAKESKEVKPLDDELGELIIKRQNLKVQEKTIALEISECENKVKLALGDTKLAAYDAGFVQYNVNWGNVKGRTGFDAKRFEKEHPELFAQYVTQGAPYRSFKVTEKEVI